MKWKPNKKKDKNMKSNKKYKISISSSKEIQSKCKLLVLFISQYEFRYFSLFIFNRSRFTQTNAMAEVGVGWDRKYDHITYFSLPIIFN